MSIFGDISKRTARNNIRRWFGVKRNNEKAPKTPFEEWLDWLFLWVDRLIAGERYLAEGNFENARRIAFRCIAEVPDVDNKLVQVLRERAKKIVAKLPEEMRHSPDY